MVIQYPSNWHEWLAVLAVLASLLAIFGNLLVAVSRMKSKKERRITRYDDDQNTANIEQILAFLIAVFLTFVSMETAGINRLIAGILSGFIGAYYLGFSWNHSTGITAKPKNTISAFVASAVLPALLMLIDLPFVLGNVLFWSLFPWAERHFFEREKVPKIPPPEKVDV